MSFPAKFVIAAPQSMQHQLSGGLPLGSNSSRRSLFIVYNWLRGSGAGLLARNRLARLASDGQILVTPCHRRSALCPAAPARHHMMKSTQRPRLASALTTTRRSLANAGLLRSQAHLEREPRFKDERINESTDEIDGERELLRLLEE